MSLIDSDALSVDVLASNRILRSEQVCLSDGALAPEYLLGKLAAAEATVANYLRISLEPFEVLPDGGSEEERAHFDTASIKWKSEPSYDMTTRFFRGDSWGFIELRSRPLIAVHSIRFVYPAPFNTIWEVPGSWIRIDPKYAHVRLVPGSQAFFPPLVTWAMQTITGGRTIPHMIHVRYRAGLEDAADYPDLLDAIYATAVLGIIDDAFIPQSGSTSVDGLSQTNSFDASKHQERIDRKLDLLKQKLYGLVFGAL